MKISRNQLDYFAGLVSQHPAQALAELQASESKYADDPNFWFNYGGFLIDGGVVLHQSEVVEHGIKMLQGLLPDESTTASPDMLYNLANGYFALYELARQQPIFHYNPDSEERRKRQHLPGRSVPMFMPLARPGPLAPQDTGV